MRFPLYQCHKKVRALKIRAIETPHDMTSGTLYFDNAEFPPRAVTGAYIGKHTPHPGGYFVLYEDGYESFSPAEAFESGYTLIEKG